MQQSAIPSILNVRILGKSPLNGFLRLNEWVWKHFPMCLKGTRLLNAYGIFMHKLVCMKPGRRQFFGTFFLRNRSALRQIMHLIDAKERGATVKIAVVACSNGAEVYSILWTIRSARPDLKIVMHAMDISAEVVGIAQKGVYSLVNPELVEEPIFERMTEQEMKEMFDKEGNHVKIKSWLQDGITWNLGDASDPEIINIMGNQDMVVANNFLCHMEPHDAERCLRNIAGIVNPGGYLFVSGVDLDIRTKVACDHGWKPVPSLVEDIHNGDPVLINDWPFKWWGLEPLNRSRADWKVRFAAFFQLCKKV